MHRVGCVLFVIIGFAWSVFTFVDLAGNSMGNCGRDPLCVELNNTSGSLVMWRGFAVGLLLILCYLFFRSMTKDDDVQ